MKRYIALLLVMLMVLVPLASCSDNSGKGGTNETGGAGGTSADSSGGDGDEVDESEVLDVPANLELGGEFTILAPTVLAANYTLIDFDEPDNTDPYRNAIYKRNSSVEEYLGIEIVETEATLGSDLYNKFKTSTEAGSQDFDACFNKMSESCKAVGSGLCLPYDDMLYIDLEKAWWNKDCSEQLALGNKHYMISGDIALSDKECIWCIYFTKDVITELNMTSPFELVENNEWTWDKMHEMAKKAIIDANANDVLDKDNHDRWGLITHIENWGAMWQSAGLKLIELDEDGVPQIAWDTEEFFNVYTKIQEIMGDKTCVSPDDDKFIVTAFPAGKALFATEVVAHSRNYAENEYDYGIVPFPKYDTTIERYLSYVADYSNVVVVGFDNADTDRTSAVLETMGAYGHTMLTPVYYEEQLKSRFARDPKTPEMLDIIFQNRSYDLGVFFNWGDANNQLRSATANPSALISSLRKNINKQIQQDLMKLDLF